MIVILFNKGNQLARFDFDKDFKKTYTNDEKDLLKYWQADSFSYREFAALKLRN